MTNQKKNLLNQLLKLSNLGIQMGLIIGLAVFAGLKADLYFKLEATFSVCFSLLGVFGALFYAIKEAKKI
tara:strand:- start:149 stop:358 length:210 start_codon:yes stop_codon:yes gene_type:complete